MISDENLEYLKLQLVEEKENYKILLSQNLVNDEELVHSLNQIIEYKFLTNYRGLDSIYLDFKNLIKHYIDSSNQKEIGYDNIDVEMISSKASKLNAQEKLLILKLFRRELRRKSFLSKSNECDKFIDQSRMQCYKENLNFKNYIFYLALLSSSSIWTLLLSILILISLTLIIIQPAPFSWMHTININFADFSSSRFINMISNILSLIFDLDLKMELEANNFFGILLLGFLKILFLSVIVNYFWKKLVEYFKFNN